MTMTTTRQCPGCGTGLSDAGGEAHRRILELEAQVKLLTSKASAAVDKLADYEDEVQRLKAVKVTKDKASTLPDTLTPNQNNIDSPAAISTSGTSLINTTALPHRAPSPVGRLTSILGVRRNNSNNNHNNITTNDTNNSNSAASNLPSTPRETSLQAALAQETALRRQTETQLSKTQGQLTQVNTEIEDMSVQLFEQANEMVASERKARAKLEERVAVLEHRDGEKRKRLERLEGALRRIERVKRLVGSADPILA